MTVVSRFDVHHSPTLVTRTSKTWMCNFYSQHLHELEISQMIQYYTINAFDHSYRTSYNACIRQSIQMIPGKSIFTHLALLLLFVI